MNTLSEEAREVVSALKKLPKAEQAAAVEEALGPHSVCTALLSATGRGTPPTPRTPPPRVYVESSPRAPLLRPLQQPLFDTLIVEKDGLFRGGAKRDCAFVENKKFADDSQKTAAHTNMTQSGMLGYPLQFAFGTIGLRIERFTDRRDVQHLMRTIAASWFFGCNTPWLRLTPSAWKPVLLAENAEKDFAEVLVAANGDGFFWPAWAHTFAVDGARRTIESTESFRFEMELTEPRPLAGPVHFKILMEETLYAQL